MSVVILESIITCPNCGHKKKKTMPINGFSLHSYFMKPYLLCGMKNSIFIFCLALSSSIFAQDKEITFLTADGSKTFSILMSDANMVQMKNKKNKQGIISGYTDSTVIFKEFKISKKNNPEFKALSNDKSLTKEQRIAAWMKITHPDSVVIPYDSIRKIIFNLSSDKKYSFQTKTAFALFMTFDFLMVADIVTATNSDINDAPLVHYKGVFQIIPIAFIASDWYYFAVIRKTIKTKEWKLKAAGK